MKLRDILKSNEPIKLIAARFMFEGSDELFGYCSWDGENLISLDGDCYSLDEEIEKWVFDDKGLAYWFKCGVM